MTVPAPFDDLPTVEDPDAEAVGLARYRYGPDAVPAEGPIPDPRYEHRPSVTLEVPEWALEATRWRLSNVEDPDRFTAAAILQEYVMPDIQFVTENGEDAVDVVLSGREP